MPNTAPPLSICRLSQYGLLAIESADNVKFLQGQLTCDLREVSAEQWRYGALCTQKGRMVGNFLLAQTTENQHLLRLPHAPLEAVKETLQKFAPFYKGILDNNAEHVLIGIAGKKSHELIQSVFSKTLTENHQAAYTEAFVVIKLDDQRYECWIKTDCFDEYWNQLTQSASEQASSYWELLNIRAGLGEVREQTIEEWTPHMLNLPAIGAVNFKKGCYTGQEIVARTEYRGKQKRVMYRIEGEGSVPETETSLYTPENSEKSIGEIVMASAVIGSTTEARTKEKEQWEALAVLSLNEENSSEEKTTLICQEQTVTFLTLPYTTQKNS